MYQINLNSWYMKLLSTANSFWGALSSITGVGTALLLVPACIVSSDLYQWSLSFFYCVDDQTVMLILTLLAIWGLSLISTLQLIKTRTLKSIFFY